MREREMHQITDLMTIFSKAPLSLHNGQDPIKKKPQTKQFYWLKSLKSAQNILLFSHNVLKQM
jgi:hypothetical protein